MKITNIKINGMKDPVGYDFSTVRISWKMSGTQSESEAYLSGSEKTKIEAAQDDSFSSVLFEKQGDLNQAGEVLDMKLLPRTRYYVRVSVHGECGEFVSDAAYFETSKMDEEWTGGWIKPQEGDTFHPVFRKRFIADAKVRSARLYISGLGMYQAFLNGKQAGEEILTPYYSNYHMQVQYQTYDVTQQLGQGENEFRVLLGNGWYKGKFGLNHQENNFGSEFMMLAELCILYEDGTETVIGSDGTWEYCGSDIEASSIYDGEVVNHLLWEGRENNWKKPAPAKPEGKLVSRYSLPVIEKEDMPVRQVIKTPAGETVLDFGQNFAGYVVFQTFLAQGT